MTRLLLATGGTVNSASFVPAFEVRAEFRSGGTSPAPLNATNPAPAGRTPAWQKPLVCEIEH